MAIMIPSTPPVSGPGAKAEREVYLALKEQLSDEHFVFHGLRVTCADGEELEIDFVVAHRLLGLVALECKGHGVRVTDGVWYRDRDGAPERMKMSPHAQAQRHIKALARELERRMRGAFPARPFVHGHAVVFPFARAVGDALPLDLPREILCTRDDLGRIGEWVERVFAFWRQTAKPEPIPLEPKDFVRFRKQVLLPTFGLIETLGTKLDADRSAIERQTEDQLTVLGGLAVNKRLYVAGAAGTGKTALAVAGARAYASAGTSVLLCCYNVGLAAHLANVCAREGACDGRIEVATFHELCHRFARAAGRDWQVPRKDDKEATKDFWDNTAPSLLFDAATSDEVPKYDAIVVDEAQDFHDHWAMSVEACLKDREDGPLAVFYDPAQRIFARKWELLERAAQHELRVNFRNTRSVARAVSEVGGVEYRFLSGAPEGEPVTFALDVKPGAATRERVDRLIEDLVARRGRAPDDIVVLSAHRSGNSLADVKTLGGVMVTKDLAARAGKVLHATIGAFKGLESDVVILIDVAEGDPLCDARARYVASSRAKLVLVVVGRGRWSQALPA